jgi:hypothetical protein
MRCLRRDGIESIQPFDLTTPGRMDKTSYTDSIGNYQIFARPDGAALATSGTVNPTVGLLLQDQDESGAAFWTL